MKGPSSGGNTKQGLEREVNHSVTSTVCSRQFHLFFVKKKNLYDNFWKY